MHELMNYSDAVQVIKAAILQSQYRAAKATQVTNLDSADQEAFLSIGFTHHRTILGACKDAGERLFYIRKCAQERMSVESLRRSIRADDFHHQGAMPNNFLETLSPGQ